MRGRACQACGMSNDETRVFCSNCGTRLEGEIVELGGSEGGETKPLTAPPLPGSGFARRRVKRPVGAPRSGGGRVFSQLVFTAVIGAFLAAIIQMARTPDGIPPREGASVANARETLDQLRAAAASPLPTTWVINRTAINEFLVTTIQMESKGGSGLSAQFQRTFVVLERGSFELGIEQRFLARSLYFLLRGVAEPGDSGMDVRWVGGSIGRLPVHPALLPALEYLYRPSFGGLAQAVEPLAGTRRVTISPADVTFEWPGTHTPEQ